MVVGWGLRRECADGGVAVGQYYISLETSGLHWQQLRLGLPGPGGSDWL